MIDTHARTRASARSITHSCGFAALPPVRRSRLGKQGWGQTRAQHAMDDEERLGIVSWVESYGYKRVALQFPDALLGSAVRNPTSVARCRSRPLTQQLYAALTGAHGCTGAAGNQQHTSRWRKKPPAPQHARRLASRTACVS